MSPWPCEAEQWKAEKNDVEAPFSSFFLNDIQYYIYMIMVSMSCRSRKTFSSIVRSVHGQLGGFRIRKQPKPTPVHTPRSLHQKVSNAPAVLPAHEGQSVNPQNEAYEDLACMAAAKELEREEEAELHVMSWHFMSCPSICLE